MADACRGAEVYAIPTERGSAESLAMIQPLRLALPLAAASPPDPLWIRGVYDGADSDDAIVAATSAAEAVEQVPVLIVKPDLIPLPYVLPGNAAGPASARFPAFHTRGPPVSTRSHIA